MKKLYITLTLNLLLIFSVQIRSQELNQESINNINIEEYTSNTLFSKVQNKYINSLEYENIEVMKNNEISITSKKHTQYVEKLDSIVEYDYIINSIIDSIRSSKSVLKYDSNDNIISSEYYNWDSINNRWIGNVKYAYGYDYNDLNIFTETYFWDDLTKTWINKTKQIKNYDSGNRLILKEKFDWSIDRKNWNKLDMETRVYDSNSNVILHEDFNWNEIAVSQKVISRYDNNNNVLNIEKYFWDHSLDMWTRSSKTVFDYDTNGNVILELRYIWSKDLDSWVEYRKNVSSFDVDNRLLFRDSYGWRWGSAVIDGWVGITRFEYKYGLDNRLAFSFNCTWDDEINDWKEDVKRTFSYDSEDRISRVTCIWDGINELWENNSKYIYISNPNGLRELSEYYEWDSVISDWILIQKRINKYDVNNNPILHIYYSLSDEGIWRGHSYSSFIYDSNYNNVLRENFQWDDNISDWKNDTKYIYNYNSDNNYTLLISKIWDITTNDWDTVSKQFYFYSKKNKVVDKIKIYPNPISTTNILTVSSGIEGGFNYSIYTLDGVQVITDFSEKSKTKRIDISTLSEGVYLLNITDGTNTISKKFIK